MSREVPDVLTHSMLGFYGPQISDENLCLVYV